MAILRGSPPNISAFDRRDRTMALLVYEVPGREWSFGTVVDHVRLIADGGALEKLYREPLRGAHDHFYGLAR